MNKTAIFWLLFIGIFISGFMLISEAIRPFFIAFIISYLLQPAIEFVASKFKLSNKISSIVVYLIFLSIFFTALTLLVPVIYGQISTFVNNIPKYKDYFQAEILPPIMTKIYAVEPNIADKIRDSLSNFINSIFTILGSLANNFWHYTLITINIFVLFLLIPIILFYFLRDWTRIIENMKSLLPLKSRHKILGILSSINSLLAAYIRGQLNICLMLSIYYSISFSVIGIDLALLLRILTGFLVIIPFIGTFISFLLTLTVGYLTFGATTKLFYIIVVYLIGNICESYILTPKIIGDKIGLHPLWIIFSIFACGSLFGFIGIFFAIPIAGVTKILLFNITKQPSAIS
ncbi:AI-2E family transporter [Rickettsia sp. MEAM1 (Bemisia tabaci)]|uniref:AI-2E family transporter n=1 Tax=Rickettsia sp. MEAM1 (Bemisia tabaci) TaxID=1182263 RepID=UPI00082C5342|nr:AI-2E family transporter [Rickettsia sp. MEAM1 (Bemisia tabaci)]ASX27363.1 AI-2E family transporter [Rickettsia sp. MEAM1 (Bemisia tabaci)]